MSTKKSAYADLVDQISSLIGWPDNLESNILNEPNFVKRQYEENIGGLKMKKSPAKTNSTGVLFVVIESIINSRLVFVKEN